MPKKEELILKLKRQLHALEELPDETELTLDNLFVPDLAGIEEYADQLISLDDKFNLVILLLILIQSNNDGSLWYEILEFDAFGDDPTFVEMNDLIKKYRLRNITLKQGRSLVLKLIKSIFSIRKRSVKKQVEDE